MARDADVTGPAAGEPAQALADARCLLEQLRQPNSERDGWRSVALHACARAFAAAGGPDAPALLEEAHAWLQATAAEYPETWRARFLDSVAEFRALRAEWQARQASAPGDPR